MVCIFFFFFKQKTAYEMRISDWSSDVCSSDLYRGQDPQPHAPHHIGHRGFRKAEFAAREMGVRPNGARHSPTHRPTQNSAAAARVRRRSYAGSRRRRSAPRAIRRRSEEHTSELQSLMRNPYAVFCLKKKKTTDTRKTIQSHTHQ